MPRTARPLSLLSSRFHSSDLLKVETTNLSGEHYGRTAKKTTEPYIIGHAGEEHLTYFLVYLKVLSLGETTKCISIFG
jgi:hypothetical protein